MTFVPNAIYILLFEVPGDRERFRWAFYTCPSSSGHGGTMYYVGNERDPRYWSAIACNVPDDPGRIGALVALQVGSASSFGRFYQHIVHHMNHFNNQGQYAPQVFLGSVDWVSRRQRTPQFNGKVWVLEMFRILAAAGVFRCNSFTDVEEEASGWAQLVLMESRKSSRVKVVISDYSL